MYFEGNRRVDRGTGIASTIKTCGNSTVRRKEWTYQRNKQTKNGKKLFDPISKVFPCLYFNDDYLGSSAPTTQKVSSSTNFISGMIHEMVRSTNEVWWFSEWFLIGPSSSCYFLVRILRRSTTILKYMCRLFNNQRQGIYIK